MTNHRSPLQHYLEKVPVALSYTILSTSWLCFLFFISIHEVLLKRGETRRFVEQMVIYHTLLGLTVTALITTTTRSPGRPDPSFGLGQADLSPPATPADDSGWNGVDDDDIPLRYLRNSQWVTTRIAKSRPSPLPILKTSTSPHSKASHSGGRRDGEGERGREAASSESEDDRFKLPAISPFPFGGSPFLPKSTEQAGEAHSDRIESKHLQEEVEGIIPRQNRNDNNYNQSQGQHDEDTQALLPSSTRTGSGTQGDTQTLFSKSNTGTKRYCKKCEIQKPDRSHHCRFCQRCTLKMDHHCIWVGNCVGFYNYKPFLLFTTYGALLAIYIAFEAGYETYRFFSRPNDYIPENEQHPDLTDLAPIVYMVLAILGVFFGLTVGGLSCFHWYLASHNKTTLEDMTHSYPSALLPESPSSSSLSKNIKQRSRKWKADHMLTRSERLRLRRDARNINVYDLGWKKNLRGLLVGEVRISGLMAVAYAMWPPARAVTRSGHAGHSFPYNHEALEKLRKLTAELRLGINSDAPPCGDSDSEDEDGYEAERDEPLRRVSDYEDEDENEDGDEDDYEDEDEGEVIDFSEESELVNPQGDHDADGTQGGRKGKSRERYPWFEP